MIESWHYVGSQLAIEFLHVCKSRDRPRLLAALKRLAENPYLKPHASETDETGRQISIVFLNGFEVSYWLDHFVKEVRVIEISKIN